MIGVPSTIRYPFRAAASAPALRRLLRASWISKSMTGPAIRISSPGPCTGNSPATTRRTVSSFSIAWVSVPPATRPCCSARWRSSRVRLCCNSWPLAWFRSLISRAMLVLSWLARLRATRACDRSCTITRKPSNTAIKLTTKSRWPRAVLSADRLRILEYERGIVGRRRQAAGAAPAEPEVIAATAAPELGELVRIVKSSNQGRRIAQRGDQIRTRQPVRIVDQDVDPGVEERGGGDHPLLVDGDRLGTRGPEQVDDVLEVLVVDDPAQRAIGRVIRVPAVVQADGQPRPVERRQAGRDFLAGNHVRQPLRCARALGALVFQLADGGLKGPDPGA